MVTVSAKPAPQEKTYSYTFSSKQFSAEGTKTLGGVDWTFDFSGTSEVYYGLDNSKGQQFGSGKQPARGTSTLTASASEFGQGIVGVKINASTASSGNTTMSINIGTTQYLSSRSLTSTATDYGGSKLANPAGVNENDEIVITFVTNADKAFYIKSITVYYLE